MELDDVTYYKFFKELQMMLIDLPGILHDFIKNISIGDIGTYNYHFNNCIFDDYFFHKTKAHIPTFYKRLTEDKYLVNIPVKGCLENITTIIKRK